MLGSVPAANKAAAKMTAANILRLEDFRIRSLVEQL
jgi:hypothetical protein